MRAQLKDKIQSAFLFEQLVDNHLRINVTSRLFVKKANPSDVLLRHVTSVGQQVGRPGEEFSERGPRFQAMSSPSSNQLGTPGVAKSFLRRAQIFQTMSNSFQLCPTDFSRWGKKVCRWGLPFPLGYGPVSNSFKVCPTHFYMEAEDFSSWLRAWFCPIALRR